MNTEIEQILKEAEAYMKSRKRRKKADWHTYESFKKRVGWIDTNEYNEFISKLVKILKI